MKKIILFPALLGLPLLAIAQWPSSVTIVESKANDSVTVSGDLSTGARCRILAGLPTVPMPVLFPFKIQNTGVTMYSLPQQSHHIQLFT